MAVKSPVDPGIIRLLYRRKTPCLSTVDIDDVTPYHHSVTVRSDNEVSSLANPYMGSRDVKAKKWT